MLINYFFISLPEPAFNAILEHCVSNELKTQALLWDGSYLVKLEGTIPNVLKSHKKHPHSKMLIEKAIREQGRPTI